MPKQGSADLNQHGGAADADHQHAAALSYHLVVNVDADHRIGPQCRGALLELVEGDFRPGPALFIGAGAAADDVADAGEQILNTLAPRMASPTTMPRYSRMVLPSRVGVVERIILFSLWSVLGRQPKAAQETRQAGRLDTCQPDPGRSCPISRSHCPMAGLFAGRSYRKKATPGRQNAPADTSFISRSGSNIK